MNWKGCLLLFYFWSSEWISERHSTQPAWIKCYTIYECHEKTQVFLDHPMPVCGLDQGRQDRLSCCCLSDPPPFLAIRWSLDGCSGQILWEGKGKEGEWADYSALEPVGKGRIVVCSMHVWMDRLSQYNGAGKREREESALFSGLEGKKCGM